LEAILDTIGDGADGEFNACELLGAKFDAGNLEYTTEQPPRLPT
jgi:hypothetical protein